MRLPCISILVPSYNAGRHLLTLVRSILDQSMQDWELVIVDDGSKDDTQAVLDRILKTHPGRLIQVATILHTGCAGALKTAMDLSTAPLCTFVGADDTITPTSLEIIVKAFSTHPRVGYLWTRYQARSEGGKRWREGRSKSLPSRRTLKQALLEGWWGALAQDCWRRSVYRKTPGLDPSLPYAVDQQLAMLFANLGCRTMHVKEVTYLHTQWSSQMSRNHYHEQQQCRAEILRRLGGTYVRER